MVTIYGVEPSPPCRAVYLVAKAIGLDFEKKEVDMENREHKSAAYLKINPQGLVPALVDGDLKIGESRAIITYLMNKYAPKSNMYPSDPAARAIVDSRLYFDVSLFAALRGVLFPMLFKKNAKESNENLPALHDKLKILESFFEQSDFVAGNKITVADLSILVCVNTMSLIHIDLSAVPKTKAWLARMQEDLPYFDQVETPGAKRISGMFLQRKKELEAK